MTRRSYWLAPLLLCVFFLALFALPFSGPGTRVVLAVATAVTPLEIHYREGSFLRGLALSSVTVPGEVSHLAMTDLFLSVDTACFWDSEICFRELRVGALDIRLDGAGSDGQAQAREPDGDVDLLRMPVALRAPRAQLGALRVRWPGGLWTQGAATLNLRAQGSRVHVASARIDAAELRIDTDAEDRAPGRISLPDIVLPLRLRVDALALAPASLVLNGEAHELQALRLSGRWSRQQLQLSGLEVDAGERGALVVREGEIEFEEDWSLRALLELKLREGLPWEVVKNRAARLRVGGDAGDLDIEVSSDGAPALAGTGKVDLLAPGMPFAADLELSALSGMPLPVGWPEPLSVTALHSPLRMAARGTTARQTVALSGSGDTRAYPGVKFTAQLQREATALRLQRVELRDAGGNHLSASGEFALAPDVRWSLRCDSGGLDVSPLHPQLQGSLSGGFATRGSLADDAWEAAFEGVSLQGEINDLPAQVSGSATLRDGALLPGSDLRAKINEAILRLSADGDGEGHLQLKVDDLGRWRTGGAGQLGAHARIAPDGSSITVQGELSGGRWVGVSAASADFEGRYERRDDGVFHARLELTDAELGSMALTSVRLDASGSGKERHLQIRSEGDVDGEMTLTGSGTREAWEGELVTSEMLALLPGGARMKGALRGEVGGSWSSDEEPRGRVALRTDALTLEHETSGGKRIANTWSRAGLEIVRGAGDFSLQAALYRQAAPQIQLALALAGDGTDAIDGRLLIDALDLAPLAPLLPSPGEMAGTLHGDLALTGSMTEPLADGALRLQGGALLLSANPTPLEDLDLTLMARGRSASISGSGVLGGGVLNLRGALSTTPLRLELEVQGREHTIFYPPSLELVASEAMTFTLSGDRLDIRGDAIVHGGELRFEELPEGSVDLSPDVVRIDTAAETLEQRVPFAVTMDLGIQIEDGFALSGTLVDSTLSGDLRLRRNPRKPLQLFGSLHTAGGTVRAFDRVLAIKRGVVSFNGNPNNPLVDLSAERTITASNVVAGVRLHGALEDDLALDIYSDPAMSQGDAMSYLIWGRSTQSGNTGDGAVVALSLASSVANRSSLVESINQVPGLSEVSFGAEGSEEDAAATVSGFIGERIYLSYGFGIYEPINVLTARLFLQARLWLEVVSRLENSLDLYYSFDIE